MFFLKLVKKIRNKNKGFTLVEILVVIALLTALTRIVVATTSNSRKLASIKVASSQLNVLKVAFQSYFFDHNDYPPAGTDHCDACWATIDMQPYAIGYWTDIIDLFVSEKILKNRIDTDPWGNPYYYDKNFKQPCDAWSVICSAGPNKTLETNICQKDQVVGGDDICVWFPDNDPWPL